MQTMTPGHDPILHPAGRQAAHPAAGAALRLDRETVDRLVGRFCERVRRDALLGPAFRMPADAWDEHVALVADFWCRVLLGTGRADGLPLLAHAVLRMKPAHFERWIALFRACAEAELEAAACHQVLDAASVIDWRLRAQQARMQRQD
jgi:truncated hemoglobin YjbI